MVLADDGTIEEEQLRAAIDGMKAALEVDILEGYAKIKDVAGTAACLRTPPLTLLQVISTIIFATCG